MLTEAFYILFFYFTGEFISYFIDGFIPGSVIGMMLLFLALVFKVVKPEKVKKLSTLLTENMGLFFLPAGVGLMNALGILSRYWAVIVTASVVSTLLVIASVALVQQKLGKETDGDE
ncbi:MAG: CidA/LrgA family protein [Parabacteroides sp.]|nr:CidA/LrgA family protein [Parabacteroides sp.]